MSEDRIATVVSLLVGGVEFADERLAPLREAMTPEEVRRVGELLIGEYVKTLPPGPGSSSATPEAPDCCWLYLELSRRGARPDDVRLAILAELMTDEELERARAAIGALWLEAEPRPARPN